MEQDKALQIVPLNLPDLINIFQNARETDKAELEALNQSISCLPFYINPSSFALLIDGEPVAAFGSVPYLQTQAVWFFATDRIEETGSIFHRVAKGFVDDLAADQIATPVIVFVWDKNNTSLQWLKHIGFEESGYRLGAKETRVIVMQYRG